MSPANSTESAEPTPSFFDPWDAVAHCAGPPQVFLSQLLALTADTCGAAAAVDLRPPESGGSWRRAASSGSGRELLPAPGEAIESSPVDPPAARFPLFESEETGTAVLLIGGHGDLNLTRLEPIATRARCAAELYLTRRRLGRAEDDMAAFGGALDLLILLQSEHRFVGAAMMVSNELSARFQADRVSVGWMEGNRVKVEAVSHTENLNRKMDAVEALAAAMEEAIDQEEEIVLPRPADSLCVTRDHERYSRQQKTPFLLTLPMAPPRSRGRNHRDPRAFEGALTLERNETAFSPKEIRALRVIADQIAPPLLHLRESDRWWGARCWRWLRRRFEILLGAEHTGWKLLGLILAIAVAVLVFVRIEHRVEAAFALRTDHVAQLSAPFPGFLDRVDAEPGDEIREGDPLFSLDTREIQLRLQDTLAEVERHAAEAVRAESEGDAASLRIARARLTQARSKQALAQFHLSQATAIAPFDGVVTEGDLRERGGAPVDQGEVLMTVARIEGLFAELKVSEKDIHAIAPGSAGAAVFASRPEIRFPVTLERVEPAARSEESGNVFLARCQFRDDPPPWWRPGMSGVAKIDAGRRSLLWILTHRTVDAFRLRFW